jgi:hypothetical protein
VARFLDAGVRVKIVSGDAAPVVLYVVEMLQIPARGILAGDEIDALADRALTERVATTDLFVRISPGQKGHIVRALRFGGNTVGFLGDGINGATASRCRRRSLLREHHEICADGHKLELWQHAVDGSRFPCSAFPAADALADPSQQSSL